MFTFCSFFLTSYLTAEPGHFESREKVKMSVSIARSESQVGNCRPLFDTKSVLSPPQSLMRWRNAI